MGNRADFFRQAPAVCMVVATAVLGNGACVPAPAPPKIADDLVYIEGGTFQMGDEHGHGANEAEFNDERPVHTVTVASFYLGRYEVTQQQWVEAMGSNPSKYKGDKNPVDYVNFYDCIEYCIARSVKEGLRPYYTLDKTKKDPNNQAKYDDLKWLVTINEGADGYRLPTEAEWEYAARGGRQAKGTLYPGSDNLDEVAEYFSNNNVTTKPVGGKKPNELGLYDMAGNVWEWLWTPYEHYPGNNEPDGRINPSFRVLRSCGYDYEENYCRVSNRTGHGPNLRSDHYGLRIARSAP